MGVHFVRDAYTYATFEKRYDSDGKVFLNCIAHTELTGKTPYAIVADEYGPISEALPAAGVYVYIGVAIGTIDDGASCWLQHGGYITGVISVDTLTIAVGHGFTINTEKVADAGNDFTGVVGEFAVNAGTEAGSTTHAMMLVPEQILTI